MTSPEPSLTSKHLGPWPADVPAPGGWGASASRPYRPGEVVGTPIGVGENGEAVYGYSYGSRVGDLDYENPLTNDYTTWSRPPGYTGPDIPLEASPGATPPSGYGTGQPWAPTAEVLPHPLLNAPIGSTQTVTEVGLSTIAHPLSLGGKDPVNAPVSTILVHSAVPVGTVITKQDADVYTAQVAHPVSGVPVTLTAAHPESLWRRLLDFLHL